MESLVEQLGADGIEARRQVRPVVSRSYRVPEIFHAPYKGGEQALALVSTLSLISMVAPARAPPLHSVQS